MKQELINKLAFTLSHMGVDASRIAEDKQRREQAGDRLRMALVKVYKTK